LPQPAFGTSDRGSGWPRVVRRPGVLLLSALLLAVPARAAEHAPKPAKVEGAENGPTFITLPPIVLPVFNSENKVTRQAGLVLALELEPGKTAADLEPNRLRLRDAFITELYALYDQVGGADRVIESSLIKQRLQETSDRVLGPGIVHAVLIQQAFERGRR
jgi:hypothetical protein